MALSFRQTHNALIHLLQGSRLGTGLSGKDFSVTSHLLELRDEVYQLRAAFRPRFETPFCDAVQRRDTLWLVRIPAHALVQVAAKLASIVYVLFKHRM
jgi:hypothetical protein